MSETTDLDAALREWLYVDEDPDAKGDDGLTPCERDLVDAAEAWLALRDAGKEPDRCVSSARSTPTSGSLARNARP